MQQFKSVSGRTNVLTSAFPFKSYAKIESRMRLAIVPRRFEGLKMELVIAIEVLVGLVFIGMFGSDVLDLDLSRRCYQCLSNPFQDDENEES
jgi:hypothetical protein